MSKKRPGLSKARPKNEARPLGTPRPQAGKRDRGHIREVQKAASSSASEQTAAENISADTQEVVDTSPATVVGSGAEQLDSAQAIPPASATETTAVQEHTMTLTYKGLSKNKKNAFFSGPATAIRIPLSAFVNKTAPQSIEVADGIFAVKAAKEAKVKLTKEQRAALPKPTLAEKIERRRQALARDEAKLAAAQQASL